MKRRRKAKSAEDETKIYFILTFHMNHIIVIISLLFGEQFFVPCSLLFAPRKQHE